MKPLITLIQQNKALTRAFCAVGLFCLGIHLYTRWDTARFEASLQTPPPVQEPPPKPHSTEPQAPQGGQAGHFHADGTFHPEPRSSDEEAPLPPITAEPHTPEWREQLRARKAVQRQADIAAWEERKRQIAKNPDLIWQPGFILPRLLGHHDRGLYDIGWNDYRTVADAVKTSDAQNERIREIGKEREKKQYAGTLSPEEEKRLHRKWDEIHVEGLDTLTAAKVFLRGEAHEPIARDYAERAVRENPNSTDALYILARVLRHQAPEEEEAVLRRMLALTPNSVLALHELAWKLRSTRPQEALGYIQKAIALDRRIPKYNELLDECYEYLGQYEKALYVYQHTPAIGGMFTPLHIRVIQEGTPLIQPVVQTDD